MKSNGKIYKELMMCGKLEQMGFQRALESFDSHKVTFTDGWRQIIPEFGSEDTERPVPNDFMGSQNGESIGVR